MISMTQVIFRDRRDRHLPIRGPYRRPLRQEPGGDAIDCVGERRGYEQLLSLTPLQRRLYQTSTHAGSSGRCQLGRTT